jgi:nucleoside-diphosphate-sugar epimerase
MPVIVIGADTETGAAIVAALVDQSAELRVFVSDPTSLVDLPGPVRVAVGDVSDGSHIGAAAHDAFCAVVIEEAAGDDRPRAFANDPAAVLAQWADGLSDAGVHRCIWVGSPRTAARFRRIAPELAVVNPRGRTLKDVGAEVAAIDEAGRLDPDR